MKRTEPEPDPNKDILHVIIAFNVYYPSEKSVFEKRKQCFHTTLQKSPITNNPMGFQPSVLDFISFKETEMLRRFTPRIRGIKSIRNVTGEYGNSCHLPVYIGFKTPITHFFGTLELKVTFDHKVWETEPEDLDECKIRKMKDQMKEEDLLPADSD